MRSSVGDRRGGARRAGTVSAWVIMLSIHCPVSRFSVASQFFSSFDGFRHYLVGLLCPLALLDSGGQPSSPAGTVETTRSRP